MSRFYNLPSAWDPGFVIPRYVMAEPPQRGTMTTQWLPRGTIDAVVPEYTLGAGKKLLGRSDADLGSLGGSCFGGSSLSGDTLGATAYQLQPTGDLPSGRASGAAPMITKYGQATARGMIAQIRRLPPSQRAAGMKQAMASIDKTLQARTENYARMATTQGVSKSKALEVGLARALSEGVVGELAKLGRRSSVSPQPSSLLGLGLDRAQKRAQGASGNYVGLGAVAYVPKSSEPAAYVPQASSGTTLATKIAQVKSGAHVMVGPFAFPNTGGTDGQIFRYVVAKPTELPAEWKTFIRDKISSKLTVLNPNNPARATWEPGVATSSPWYAALGFPPGMALPMAFFNGRNEDGYKPPLALFKHPTSGNMWGVYLALSPDDQNPNSLQIYFRWLPANAWYAGIVGVIAAVVGAPVKGAEEVAKAVEWVGEQTCNLLSSPNAVPAAAAANPAAGAGAIIAQQICGGATPPPVIVQGSSSLIWYLLAGGGVLAAIALTQPKD